MDGRAQSAAGGAPQPPQSPLTMPRPGGLRRVASALAAAHRGGPHGRGLAAAAGAAPAPDDSFEVTVNGVPTRVPKGASVMAACDAAGVDIPR